ncbi:LOW QUALITY PROTEIN: zf-RVT domain-containing protein, partial [Cephalotus follicularis]
LGLPLVPRRLSALDCRCLTLKMVNKILSWTSTRLSFSGRLQLMQATLSGILNFWTFNNVLPKSTLLDCERIMRNYLWAGSTAMKQSKVSWAQVCKPKEEGGLDLRRPSECNKAAMLRLIWEILANTLSLVTWKRLLGLRPLVSANLVYTIGHNSSWSLWYDPWFQDTPLFPRLGDRAIYDSGMPHDPSLSEVLHDTNWNWPTHVWQLRDIIHSCTNIPIGQRDSIGWRSAGGAFSFKLAWESFRLSAPTVPAKVVWYSEAIRKHSFCFWLTFRKVHLTLDKLHGFGVVQQIICPFGCGQQETLDHLFFYCAYTKTV